MRIEIVNDIDYLDCKISKGTVAKVLMAEDYMKMPRGYEKTELSRARGIYKKRGIDGAFVHLKGKWRWVYKDDYKLVM